MANEVYMDVPQVQKLADKFGDFQEVLQGVAKTLEIAINLLRATAFIGAVGNFMMERYLSMVKPRVEKLAVKMGELQKDVNEAIKNYQTGDTSGSSHFT